MKTLSWILLSLLLPQATPQDRPPASLDGVVVNFGTDVPIAKADVELRRIADPGAAPAPPQNLPGGLVFAGAPPAAPASPMFTTSADGKFSFKNIPPGNYRLYVTRANGHIPGEYGQRSPVGTGTPLTLSSGQSLSNVRLSMAPTSSISGRIVDGDGDPVTYARVQALRVAYEEGQRVLISVRGTSTDDRGEYRIYSLPPGEYYIASRPPDSRATRNFGAAAIVRFGGGQGADAPVVTLRATDAGIVEETWRAIFYPGSFDARSAQVIPLGIGQDLRGIDINLGASATPALHVRGTVVDTTIGRPAIGATIRLLPRHQLTPSVIMPSATSDAAGRFDVPGVLSGSYSVIVNHAGAAPQGTVGLSGFAAGGLSGFAVIDVGNTNIDGLQIPVLPGVDIPLNIAMPGVTFDPAWIKNLRMTLHRKPVVTGAPVGGGTITAGWPGLGSLFANPEITPTDNGGLMLRGVPLGDFTVEISGIPQGGYVKSVSLGRTDVLAEGLQVMRPVQNSMELVIATDSGTLTGRVFDARLQPTGNVTAVLVPDPARRYRVDLYQSSNTDGQGAFRFDNIAPGEYKMFAWEDVMSGAWHDPDFLRSRESLGTVVRIAPGKNQPVDVKVIPWVSGQ